MLLYERILIYILFVLMLFNLFNNIQLIVLLFIFIKLFVSCLKNNLKYSK